jgi:hypothetical protein
MASRLTESIIQKVKAREKRYKLYDESGLFLLVASTGGRWWRIRYRFDGKEKQLSLGTYPKVSLSEARALRDNTHQMISQGIDPSAIRKAEKAERKQNQMEQSTLQKAGRKQSKNGVNVSVRSTMDGPVEIWKGSNAMSLSKEETRFVVKQLSGLMEAKPCR